MATLGRRLQPRSTISDQGEGLRISIPAQREWVILFLVLWLAFWTHAGIQTIRTLIHHFSFFLAVWMTAWAFGEWWAIGLILYTLGGSEIILVRTESLTRTRKIFGLGWSRLLVP